MKNNNNDCFVLYTKARQELKVLDQLTDEKEMEVGRKVKVPYLDQEADVISVKGKNCIVQFEMLGSTVSFQLS